MSPCPRVEDLREFRLGRMAGPSARQVEQHLPSCPSCVQRLSAVPLDDPLVQGLRAQRNQPRFNNPLLAQVQQELHALRPTPIPYEVGLGTTSSRDERTIAAPAEGWQMVQSLHPLLSPPRAPDELGWLGTYRVLKLLGEGGMGMVLLAEDTRLQRKVALKIMKPTLAADMSARQRFLKEARATARLEHIHVVAIHHIDEVNGVPFLAMPLLHGESLDDRLKREGLLSVSEVIRIGRETAEGLAAAHGQQLIHRDIKPGNLWLEAPLARVKILDFGLAAMPSSEGDKTLPGTILGTPGYMAPEQTEGETDHRADLFSLGCVLYRMATGQAPFKGDTLAAKLRSTLFDNPQPPQEIVPALPPALCHLILQLLAKKPGDRPQTALAVARILETIEMSLPHPGQAPMAIPLSSGSHPDITVPLAIPLSGPNSGIRPATVPLWKRLSLDQRGVQLGAGIGAAVLLLLVVVLALSGKKGEPKGNGGGTSNPDEEEQITKRPPPPPKRVVESGGNPTTVETAIDRSFQETWVTRPAKVNRVEGWSIETNEIGRTYPGSFEFINGEHLLIRCEGTSGNSWRRFNPKTSGLDTGPFEGNYDALSPNGKMCGRVVTGGVELWDEGQPTARLTLRSPSPSGYAAVFSPDGKKLVTFMIHASQQSNEFWFWDPDRRKGGKIAECRLSDYVWPKIHSWSLVNDTLALSTYTSRVGVLLFRAPWNKPQLLIPRLHPPSALAWSPTDGELLAMVENGKLFLLRLHGEDEPKATEVPGLTLPNGPDVLAWSPDGKELAFATRDKKVVVWNLEKSKATFILSGHTRDINAVAYLPDNKTLVSGSIGSVRFWDLEKASLRGSLLSLSGTGWLAISPEGNFRCSDGAEERFRIKFREEGFGLRELKPDDFRKTFGWKNHPEKVQFVGE